ncbi:hypothetical protein OG394_38400 [Kribbella sp. NBC_01245]|uniref:hypothetical protein n=1 Tax=Kribbella sp. NBC_01245 TaxID=2903578 RepID=UPI002E2CB638|nr:hypothetical protein [Kribbella sp. NBC_01245]
MQTLLDARPLGLIVVGDALVTYDERGLTADSLTRLIPATAAIAAGVTPYVIEHWGFRTGPPGPLRFTGRRWNQSQWAWVFRLIGGSATILGVTLAACLVAAIAEGLTLARSGANLWTAVGVLAIVALVSWVGSSCTSPASRHAPRGT